MTDRKGSLFPPNRNRANEVTNAAMMVGQGWYSEVCRKPMLAHPSREAGKVNFVKGALNQRQSGFYETHLIIFIQGRRACDI